MEIPCFETIDDGLRQELAVDDRGNGSGLGRDQLIDRHRAQARGRLRCGVRRAIHLLGQRLATRPSPISKSRTALRKPRTKADRRSARSIGRVDRVLCCFARAKGGDVGDKGPYEHTQVPAGPLRSTGCVRQVQQNGQAVTSARPPRGPCGSRVQAAIQFGPPAGVRHTSVTGYPFIEPTISPRTRPR